MKTLRTFVRLLAVALPLYFLWEMAQMPAFTGIPDDWGVATAWCALATLGDGLLVLVTFAVGVAVFGQLRWFIPFRPGRYAFAVLVGIVLHALAEWILVDTLGLWGYADWQPRVPVVGFGVLVVLQPLVLLPLIFWLLAWMEARRMPE